MSQQIHPNVTACSDQRNLKQKTYCTATSINTNLIQTMKHGGSGVMIWICFAATRPGHLVLN